MSDTGYTLFFAGVALYFVGLLIWSYLDSKKSRKRAEQNGGVDPVQAELEARKKEAREARKRRAEALKAEAARKAYEKSVVKTRILTEGSTFETRGSVGSAAGRAIVGGMIAGFLGAMIGAATGKTTTKVIRHTTFRVWYGSGKTKVVTVANGTPEWEEYMKKLES